MYSPVSGHPKTEVRTLAVRYFHLRLLRETVEGYTKPAVVLFLGNSPTRVNNRVTMKKS